MLEVLFFMRRYRKSDLKAPAFSHLAAVNDSVPQMTSPAVPAVSDADSVCGASALYEVRPGESNGGVRWTRLPQTVSTPQLDIEHTTPSQSTFHVMLYFRPQSP